ncbi:MAG: membrane dipeptidase [Tabrizicola sp.]|nr:membrane dipeptidase [Tabrizicola sp.]
MDAYDLIWEAHAGIFPAPGRGWEALRAYRDAGFSHVSLNVGFDLLDGAHALATARDWSRRIAASDWAQMAGSLAGIEAARAAGKLSVAFDIEGAVALGGDAGNVEVFHQLGVRQMLLAYNRNTDAAGGCHDDDHGLTAFGRRVVAEMNRLGMIVDGAHAGERTVMDLLEASQDPVVISHAGCKALAGHGRNVSDAVVRAVAAQGGVVGICGIDLFLGGPADARVIADHIDHVASVAGPAHVALGLDWFPTEGAQVGEDVATILAAHPEFWPPAEGYGRAEGVQVASPSIIVALKSELLNRGWSAGDCAALFGGNFARVARQVWRG